MNQIFSININPDEEGFIGRECPKCKDYFKVKFDTGLPTQYHICPYCGYKENYGDFFTKEQIEYAKSVAVKKALEPIFDNFHKSLKKLKPQQEEELYK
jgi:phage FluMu protein Com